MFMPSASLLFLLYCDFEFEFYYVAAFLLFSLHYIVNFVQMW